MRTPAGDGVDARGAVKTIPDGEAAGKVGLAFRRIDRVMRRVHARRRHDPRQPPLQRVTQRRVRMVEEHRGNREALPRRQHRGRDADDHHLRRAPRNRGGDLTGVEPEPGRGVEVQIDVVDEMKTPQPRHPVHQDVPQIQRVVEQRQRDQPAEPGRAGDHLRQSPAPARDRPRQWHHHRRLEQVHRRRRGTRNRQVAATVYP